MKQRRVRLDRLEGVEQRFHLLVLDVDQFHRLFGNRLAVGRHRRYFLADKPDSAVGEDRHIVDFPADQKTFDVFAGGNRVHAGQSPCSAGIDLGDAAVGNRAAQNFTPEHFRQHHVSGI
jgi:hypothetical protein